MPVLLGLDIGTTSTIGILIDEAGGTLATASRPATLHSDHPNWAEEDPEQWWSNVGIVTRDLLAASRVPPASIVGVGVTGMVPALVLLDAQGRVLRRSIQQNDARAIDEIDAMKGAIDGNEFFRRTGGSINQQVVATKLRWLERHEPEVFARIATVFGSYDFIAWRLTGARSVEQNWALESGLADIGTGAFDPALVALAGIARDRLPPIRASHAIIGAVSAEAAAATGLAAGTPVVAGCADHVASAYVTGAVAEGDLVLKFGGAGDILLSTDRPLTDPRLFIDHHIVPGLWFSNGCMAASGSLLNWIVREWAGGEAGPAAAAGLPLHAWLDRLAAATPAGADGLVMLPYVLGEKTPLHDPHARGTLIGLGLHHRLAHVWRAALEGVAFGFRHHVDVFRERGADIRRIVACDGGAASDLWLQICADVLDRPVQRLRRHPGSCLGAAYVAGVGVGVFKDWQGIARYVEPGEIFAPDSARIATYDRAYAVFRDTYRRLQTLYPSLAFDA
ncbi:MAG TPA: FGGY family carbohydrate kinase [Methylomirabilota bacterium]|nr:FGGY family carbohydrate kinase [Methylomirabilota bacterium]